MNNITLYIIEKLKISKDSKTDFDDLDIIDKYKIGDICLLFSFYPTPRNNNARHNYSPPFFLVDVVKIIKQTKTSFICEYITKYSHYRDVTKESVRTDRKELYSNLFANQKVIISGNDIRKYSILIPQNKCNEYLDYILSLSKYEISGDQLVSGNLTNNNYYTPYICEKHPHYKYNTWDTVNKIKKETLEDLKSYFK